MLRKDEQNETENTSHNCLRNPNVLFKHAVSPCAGVIIGDLIGGFLIHRTFAPKLSNILLGFVVSTGYALGCMEVNYQYCKNNEIERKLIKK